MRKNIVHSEDIARDYLLNNGYSLDDFLFCTWNPDFITRDGQRWEVKKINKYGVTYFTYNQIYEYSKTETNIIAIYKDTVLFVKPYSELKELLIKDKMNLNKILCIIPRLRDTKKYT